MSLIHTPNVMYTSRSFKIVMIVLFSSLIWFVLFYRTKPSAPKYSEELELAANMVLESVEPGMALQKDSTNVHIWDTLKSAGSFGAYVSDDGTYAILRMSSFPRNHVLFYRPIPMDSDWEKTMERLEIIQVDKYWFWRECKKGYRRCF